MKEEPKTRLSGWSSLGVHLLSSLGETVQKALQEKEVITIKHSDRYMRYARGYPTIDGRPCVVIYRRFRKRQRK